MIVHFRTGAVLLLSACLSVTAAMAVAAPLQGADAVKARQSNFKAMGKNFKIASDQLKSDKPDLAAIKDAAHEVKGYSMLLPTWFPKGSGPETGLKMQAKAGIWTDPAAFAAAAQKFQVEAAKFDTLAATSTDLAVLRAQFKATGQTCGACHDKYREKD